MPRIAYLYLAAMVVSWAAGWPLMKLALGDVGLLPFTLLRLGGTLALLVPFLLARRTPLLPVPDERLGLLWVGQLQVAGYLICSIIGLAIVPAGRAIVLAFTMPLWAIPIGLWLWPEPLGRFQIAGAAVGFAGLMLFMNPTLVDWSDFCEVAGNGLLLLAAICWALGSCLYRRRIWRSPFWVQAARGQRCRGRGDRLARHSRSADSLVARFGCDPRLQLGRDHGDRLFPVGQSLDHGVGRGRRPGAGADGGPGTAHHKRDRPNSEKMFSKSRSASPGFTISTLRICSLSGKSS